MSYSLQINRESFYLLIAGQRLLLFESAHIHDTLFHLNLVNNHDIYTMIINPPLMLLLLFWICNHPMAVMIPPGNASFRNNLTSGKYLRINLLFITTQLPIG